MKVSKLQISGLLLIEPIIFKDKRGFFFEAFNKKEFESIINKKITFVQDNQSLSSKGVIRGLHLQKPPFSQGKLIRVLSGEIFDVVLDLRKNSKTYGKHLSVSLSDKNNHLLWVPKGFAHGFQAVSEYATVIYKVDKYYDKTSDISINPLDQKLNINWPIKSFNISEKDKFGLDYNELSKLKF